MSDVAQPLATKSWPKAMTLSYHLGYPETILVHPTRRLSFANTVQPD